MAPDLPTPSGGIKVIYRYVEHLCALGYDARVWHGTPGLRLRVVGFDRSGRHGHRARLRGRRRPGDARDGRLEVELPVAGATRGDAVPGHGLRVRQLRLPHRRAGRLSRAGRRRRPPSPSPTRSTPSSSGPATPDFPLHNVPVQIEDWFQPAAKERRIALMPRRRREDLLGRGPARPPVRSARRLADRADRRHDPAAGGRRARPSRDLPLRCRARGSRPPGRRGDGVGLLRRRLHRRRRQGVHAPRALLRHRRLRRGRTCATARSRRWTGSSDDRATSSTRRAASRPRVGALAAQRATLVRERLGRRLRGDHRSRARRRCCPQP